ncbi:hypothetical protein EYF80_061804 [Liparis tanakae]|uniref:Uncharacterized protein n=1 Tax=Liparis tanakae TaxID=230148 RepID=A0A4Z2EH00_9TELE|nr:hypothetical protein EYF80_061804 [Liparis tanakae]
MGEEAFEDPRRRKKERRVYDMIEAEGRPRMEREGREGDEREREQTERRRFPWNRSATRDEARRSSSLALAPASRWTVGGDDPVSGGVSLLAPRPETTTCYTRSHESSSASGGTAGGSDGRSCRCGAARPVHEDVHEASMRRP